MRRLFIDNVLSNVYFFMFLFVCLDVFHFLFFCWFIVLQKKYS